MKYVKLFEEFSNMHEGLKPAAKLELEKLGAGFESDEEIANAIVVSGFRKIASRRPEVFTFVDPSRNVKYESTPAGYVRYKDPNAIYWLTGEPITTKTPIHKEKIESSRDRLLLILRRAMKLAEIYKDWKRTNLTAKEFLEKSAVHLTARKFGV